VTNLFIEGFDGLIDKKELHILSLYNEVVLAYEQNKG
jgi:hypothetical protein